MLSISFTTRLIKTANFTRTSPSFAFERPWKEDTTWLVYSVLITSTAFKPFSEENDDLHFTQPPNRRTKLQRGG
jgi:hypothetical protein